MKLAAAGAGVLHGIKQHRMFEEFAILDHQFDPRRIHVDDAAGADIQVSDFAVAHLIVRQPHVLAAGVNQRIGIFAEEPVVNRLASKGDGVSFGFGAVAPAVEDDEDYRLWVGQSFSSWLLAFWVHYRFAYQ